MHAVRRGVVTTMTTGTHIIATCDAPTSRESFIYKGGWSRGIFDFTGKTAIVQAALGHWPRDAKGIVAGGGHVALIAGTLLRARPLCPENEGNRFYQLDVADAPKARETVEPDFRRPAANQYRSTALASSAPRSSTRSTTPSGAVTIDINLNGTFTMMNRCAALRLPMPALSSTQPELCAGRDRLAACSAHHDLRAQEPVLTVPNRGGRQKEGGRFGVRCNAVCPSLTLTDMTSILSDENSPAHHQRYSSERAARASEPAQMGAVLRFRPRQLRGRRDRRLRRRHRHLDG